MSTEICRHIFDAIEDSAFFHDAQSCMLLTKVTCCREANVNKSAAHQQSIQAKQDEVVS